MNAASDRCLTLLNSRPPDVASISQLPDHPIGRGQQDPESKAKQEEQDWRDESKVGHGAVVD